MDQHPFGVSATNVAYCRPCNYRSKPKPTKAAAETMLRVHRGGKNHKRRFRRIGNGRT